MKLEEALRNRILYIGEEIPEAVANDPRPKFVLLGYPQQVIDEVEGLTVTVHHEGEITDDDQEHIDKFVKYVKETSRI